MPNPHLGCGNAQGYGVGLEIDKCIRITVYTSLVITTTLIARMKVTGASALTTLT